jgi:TatD DNase family protein
LESYEPVELDNLIARANSCGIRRIIANGITLRSSAKSVEIAEQYSCIWAAVGLHPFYAPRLINAVNALKEFALKERVVGIGEIGLDFFRYPESKEIQLHLFDQQLKLAVELDLPVIIHTKAAHHETMTTVKNNGIKEEQAIIQGFRDDLATMEDWLKLGCYLSIGPTILGRPSAALAEVIRQIPAERLLLETDARAGRTLSQGLEPATLKQIAERVAEIRNVSIEDIAAITTKNFLQVFRIKETNDI